MSKTLVLSKNLNADLEKVSYEDQPKNMNHDSIGTKGIVHKNTQIDLGIFLATYNKNNGGLYTSFTSNIVIGDKVICAKCIDDDIMVNVQKLVAKFFIRVDEMEESDIIENPIKTEILEKKVYKGTDIIRKIRMRVYKDNI